MKLARKVKRVLLIVVLVGLWQAAGPKQIADAQVLEEMREMEAGLQSVVPLSIQMVDSALSFLSKGRSEMTPDEGAVFDLIFDPAGTGQTDEAFLEEVLGNMRRIKRALATRIRIRYAPDSPRCADQRLYYTDMVTVSICPYFLTEADVVRKARGLVHEMAHKALLVVDRPYFAPYSEAYTNLTPWGGRSAQLPLIGRLLREVARDDTLYHPDAYAHLAAAFSGIPGELELYLRFIPEPDGPETPTYVAYH